MSFLFSVIEAALALCGAVVIGRYLWNNRTRVRQVLIAPADLYWRIVTHKQALVEVRRAKDRDIGYAIVELRMAMRIFGLHLRSCALSSSGVRAPYADGQEGCTCDFQRIMEPPFPAVLSGGPLPAFALLDAARRIQFVSDRFLLLSGYGRELIGQSVRVLVPERVRAEHDAWETAYMAQPRVRQIGSPASAVTLLNKEGREVPVELGLYPVQGHDGKTGILVIVRLRLHVPW